MCAVSAISQYGQGIDTWNQESLDAFAKLLEAAKKFDVDTKQPDCEDPKKLKWLEVVKEETK